MTDNRTTELLKDYAFALRRLEYDADKPGSNMTLNEYEAKEKRVTDEYAQAIAAALGSNQELIDLAHNAWSIAICAMQGMGIPADWGNSVEQGLRKYGIDVDSLPFVAHNSSRWFKLFGTPEWAARTMVGKCSDCFECVLEKDCEYGCDEGCLLRDRSNYNILLEWLKGSER